MFPSDCVYCILRKNSLIVNNLSCGSVPHYFTHHAFINFYVLPFRLKEEPESYKDDDLKDVYESLSWDGLPAPDTSSILIFEMKAPSRRTNTHPALSCTLIPVLFRLQFVLWKANYRCAAIRLVWLYSATKGVIMYTWRMLWRVSGMKTKWIETRHLSTSDLNKT